MGFDTPVLPKDRVTEILRWGVYPMVLFWLVRNGPPTKPWGTPKGQYQISHNDQFTFQSHEGAALDRPVCVRCVLRQRRHFQIRSSGKAWAELRWQAEAISDGPFQRHFRCHLNEAPDPEHPSSSRSLLTLTSPLPLRMHTVDNNVIYGVHRERIGRDHGEATERDRHGRCP